MPAVDLMILVLLGGFTARGAAKGLWKTAVRLGGSIAALGAAWMGLPGLKAWASGDPGTSREIRESVLGPFLEQLPQELALKALKDLAALLDTSALPTFVKKRLLEVSAGSSDPAAVLNDTVLTLVCFAVLLLGAMVLIQGAALLLDGVSRLPGLGLMNRLAGAAAGCAEGLIVCWTTLAVLTPWIAFRPNGWLADLLAGSHWAQWLYQNNPVLWVVRTLMT